MGVERTARTVRRRVATVQAQDSRCRERLGGGRWVGEEEVGGWDGGERRCSSVERESDRAAARRCTAGAGRQTRRIAAACWVKVSTHASAAAALESTDGVR